MREKWKLELFRSRELIERCKGFVATSVSRNQRDLFFAALRFDRAVRAASDRAIYRHGALVKKIQRPNVERCARQIYSRGSSSFDFQIGAPRAAGLAKKHAARA